MRRSRGLICMAGMTTLNFPSARIASMSARPRPPVPPATATVEGMIDTRKSFEALVMPRRKTNGGLGRKLFDLTARRQETAAISSHDLYRPARSYLRT